MADRRTVIVTGGNSGLGYECVRAILEAGEGWKVVIAGRSLERSEEAARRLGGGALAMLLDLGSLAAVRRFVEEFAGLDLPPLGALVCNAGVQFVGETRPTEDGFEATFGVNHLGHFLLANLLLPRFEAPARLVFVSSGTHDPAQKTGMPHPIYQASRSLAFPEGDSLANPGQTGRTRYTTSKLCNILCAYEFGRRIGAGVLGEVADPVDVFAFDPGLMPGTGLARGYGPALRFVWSTLGPSLVPLLRALLGHVATPAQSGRSLARLVLDPALQGQGGRYFEGAREIRSSLESYDEAKAAELWDGGAELVGLPTTSAFHDPNLIKKG